MKLAAADRRKLLPQLDRLTEAIEELLLTGLTTASETTIRTLGVAFQEASRLRLLRLSGTLRIANEELSRFTRGDEAFSQRRLVFFLNRAWLLGKGLSRSIHSEDSEELARLMWAPTSTPVKQIEAVTLGVVKKVAAGAFVAFEFRMRTVYEGQPLIWSTVFPLKSGVEIPPEGFLHIPQPQKFTAAALLERKRITFENAALSEGENGLTRIQLSPESKVTTGKAFKEWDQLLTPTDAAGWQSAADRIAEHQPGPLELAVELHEEVTLADWDIELPVETVEGSSGYPVTAGGVSFEARVSTGIEGKATRKVLKPLIKKKTRPPLYGLLHYESCRLVLQPMTLLTDDGPQYLTISDESIDRKALLQTLQFT